MATVIASGLVGNLWYLLNPWAAISDAVNRVVRLGPRAEAAQRRCLAGRRGLPSQYPMLLLMVMYTMTSLWILAQPVTAGG